MPIDPYELYKKYCYAKSKHTSMFVRSGKKETFESRPDYKSFLRLGIFLPNNGIKTEDMLVTFLEVNAKRLDTDFFPARISTKECIEYYNNYKPPKKVTIDDYYRNITTHFKNINNFCIENQISPDDYFNKGGIPEVLRQYKNGKVAEEIVVFCGCVDPTTIKKTGIKYIFIKKLMTQYSKIYSRIKRTEKLSICLERGMEYLNNEFISRSN